MSRASSLRAPERATSVDTPSVARLCGLVRDALCEQVAAWRERSFFERHFIAREFRQRAGQPIEEWIDALERLEHALDDGRVPATLPPLRRLAAFYAQLAELAAVFLRDAPEREQQLAKIGGWKGQVEQLAAQLDARAR